MQNNIIYERNNNNIECIYYKDVVQSYPMHTHAKHVTFGHVLDGIVRIIYDGGNCLYHAGEKFCILPDIPHAVESVKRCTRCIISENSKVKWAILAYRLMSLSML